MKKLIVVVLVATLGFSINLKANSGMSIKNNHQVELFDVLKKAVDFPKNTHSLESTSVWLTFQVNNDGHVNPLAINGDKLYAEHIRKKVADVKIDNHDFFGRMYRIKITFNAEEM